MHIAILTFQGFNELDSFVALGVLNRVKKPGWRVTLCCPEPTVTSMNGVVVHAQSALSDARSADAVALQIEQRPGASVSAFTITRRRATFFWCWS